MQRTVFLLMIGSFSNLVFTAVSRWDLGSVFSQAMGLRGYADFLVSTTPGNLLYGNILGQFGAVSIWLMHGPNRLSWRLSWSCFFVVHVWMFYIIASGPSDWQPLDVNNLLGRGLVWFLGTLSVVALLTYPMRQLTTADGLNKASNPHRLRHISTAQLLGTTLAFAILVSVARTLHTTTLSSQLVYDTAVGLGSGLAAVFAVYSFHLVTRWTYRIALAGVAGLCCGFMVEGPMGVAPVNVLETCIANAMASFSVMIAATVMTWRNPCRSRPNEMNDCHGKNQ